MQVKQFLYKAVFLVGWVLSPFTSWNDAFVNVPISYILANLCIKFMRVDFLFMVLVFYWLSNALGIFMMYIGGRKEVLAEKGRGRGLINLVMTVVVYSALLFFLDRCGILKPIIK